MGTLAAALLAHELYRLLANTKSHGKSALTSSKISPDDLLYDHLVFEEKDLRRMFPALRDTLMTRGDGCRSLDGR